ILAADAGSHSDQFTIDFAVSGTIDLESPLPDLANTIAVNGPGADSLTVERDASVSFSSAIVTVDAGQSASLSGLTIANGEVDISPNASGILNNGTLTVSDCTISGNSLPVFSPGGGSGIANFGTLTVSDCTIGDSALPSRTGGGSGI